VESTRGTALSDRPEPAPPIEDEGPGTAGGWVPELLDPETAPDGLDAAPGSGQDHPPDVPDVTSRPRRAHRVRQPRRRPWGRTAQRWVPEALRDSRIDPGKRGALLLTVVAAVAALVAAVGVWRDRPEPRPVQAVSLTQVTDGSSSGFGDAVPVRSSGVLSAVPPSLKAGMARSSESTAVVGGPIVVSVTGAVRRPGLVFLAGGARVADAIDKAGGPTAQADLTGLNLAEKLTDGASVVVGNAAAAAGSAGGKSSLSGSGAGRGVGDEASAGASAVAGKLDLNTTDAAALDALPGVGPVTAASIVAWREKNGRFTAVEQLQEISGIGPAKYAALSALVTVGG
jgi:competence protein ComEA